MINEAKASQIPPILITPTGATNADFSNPADPLTIRAELLRKLAGEAEVMLADVSSEWLAAIKSGTPQKDLLSQSNHPNLRGHEIASSVITQTFLTGIDGSVIVRGDQLVPSRWHGAVLHNNRPAALFQDYEHLWRKA